MENNENEKAPEEPKVPTAAPPPRRPSGNGKWIAIIIALLVVISVLAILPNYHPSGSTAKIVTASESATLNQPYNLTVQANGMYKNLTVNWGDGNVQTYNYQGSDKVTVQHTYTSPGAYYIYYSFNFGSTSYNNVNNLIPVHINAEISGISASVAYGLMQLEHNSTSPLVNNSMIFTPGTNLSFIAGYFSAPADGVHQVVGQNLATYLNGTGTGNSILPYAYSMADQQYELSASGSFVNMSFKNSGMYTLGLQTTTAVPMTTTGLSTTVTNTTTVSYAKNQAVRYYDQANLTYGSTANFTTGPPTLSYLAGTNLTETGPTNLTVPKGSTATALYPGGANLAFPLFKTITVDKGANFTMNGYANATFINNGTFLNGTTGAGVSQSFNNSTSSVYGLLNGHYYNFSQKTTFQLVDQSANQTFMVAGNSTFSYGDGIQVTDWNTDTVNYTKNSTLVYTNTNTSVTYNRAINATISIDVMGDSAPVNVGEIDPTQGTYTTTYFYDIPIFASANQYVAPTAGTSFTSAEVAPGGYTSLDPQIQFYTVDQEVLINTMMPLVNTNGTSSSTFVPDVASAVPSVANGGISSNGLNYTFHIRSGLTWQDGSPVTVYDAYYAMVRLMLFVNAQPGTGSYLLGEYLLPAPFYDHVDYYNITHAITFSNTTNNITLHFQTALSPTVVEQLISTPEAYPVDANWLIQHGAGIQFTPSGFQNYTAQGNIQDYNTYIQNHIMADGPYQISYNLPGQQLVLTTNSNFVSPGPWEPAASIKTVTLQYLSQPSTAFLELKSGAAQSAIGIPATPYWPQIEQLAGYGGYANSNPSLQIKSFPTLGIYFYNFNVNVNTTLLHTLVHNENLPAQMFVNPNARKAFDYAYNYSQYLNQEVGNALYNTTFALPYVGMLPPGMVYNQSISQLKSILGSNAFHNINGTAWSDLTQAKQYWNQFINGTDANANDNGNQMHITLSASGQFQYKGNNLVIPIFVPIGDQPDTAGATTWASMMEQVIPGATFPITPVSYTQIFATFAVPGGNPMPVSWGGWAPDYIYPTDYELSMSMPTNLSTYMLAAGYNPWYISGGNNTATSVFNNPYYNYTEAASMNASLRAYDNGTANATSNPTMSKYWFHQVNYYIVNQTMNVNLYQVNYYWTISSKINGNDITNYQMNLLSNAGNELYYWHLSYNTTT